MSVEDQKKPGKARHLWRALRVIALLAVVLAGAAGYLAIRGLSAPEWLRAGLERRLNDSIPSGKIHISAIRLAPLDDRFSPQISLVGVELRDAKGRIRAALPRVTGRFDGAELLHGRLRPVSIRVRNARMLLARDPDGQFDISIGDGNTNSVLSERGNFGALATQFEALFNAPLLSSLKLIESTGTEVYLNDHQSGRKWNFRNGNLVIENAARSLTGAVTFKLENEAGHPAEATFGWRKDKGAATSELSVKFSGLQTEDVASQVAAFDWLRLLQAPIGGSMTLDVKADGGFGRMHGVLDLGAGRVRQSPAMRPFRFSGAKAYFSYDPVTEKFTFEQINVQTGAGSLRAEGQAYLGDRIDRTVGALIGQFTLSGIRLNPKGVFAKPIALDSVALDVRIRIDPLIVDIGQMVLLDGATRFVVKGRIKAGQEGWTSALDLSANGLSQKRLMEFWPLLYKEKTRDWMVENVLAGRLENIEGVWRDTPGKKPVFRVGFDMTGTSVRFMKKLPPIEQALGYGVFANNMLRLDVQQGIVKSPDGSLINLAGSAFTIMDTRVRNAPARVDLKTRSSMSGLLSVLDLKPFEFLKKAGMSTKIARGAVRTSGNIRFPLSGKVTFDQLSLAINGTLSDVSSKKLVRGKTLRAKTLTAFVDNRGLTISGAARLNKLPVSGLWRQEFGPKFKGKSRVEGQIELSKTFVDTFGIGLPDGAVSGRATGHMVINLARGKDPAFRLVSDLNRVQLALPAVGWEKPKNQKGSLEVTGSFGKIPKVTSILLTTRGLKAVGSISLKKGGKLDVARFSKIDVGGWLQTSLDIRQDPGGGVVFALNGGTLDLRKSRFSSPEATGGTANRITARLDRLILSSGISLTDVQGALSTGGGMSGSFSGKVNGGTEIKGALAPQKGGTAVRFTSEDAGAVMRSSGLFQSAIGGRLDMILVPSGKPGVYNGTLKAKGTRVRNATALADILSAISVVGLLEQLGGDGILFNDVSAKFRLSPTAVSLSQSSAVGASLGLTMAGIYSFKDKTMDMQGVITPIYLLNGVLEQAKIFGKLFGKQKGEGLFGFNYTLRGDVDAPKVGVNPLSILTPGLFREIFRRPVPTEGGRPRKKKKPPQPVGGQEGR